MRLERGQHRRHRRSAVVRAGAQRAAVERDLARLGHALERGARGRPVAVGQLDLDRVAAQLALERVRRAAGHDPPAVDDRELRRQPVGLLEVVRGQQDRHALLAREPLDLRPHLGARLGVEPGGGLVEEQHLRAVEQAHGDVEPALHAAGVGLHLARGGVGEPEALERLGHPALQLGAGDPVELALDHEVLAAGGVGVDAVLLAHDADRMADAHRLGEDVETGHAGAARVGAGEGGEDADGGALAGAVGAQQAEHGARLDLEVEAVERAHVARVGLDEAVRLDRVM